MFDNVVNLVLPAGLRCVNEVLSGSYGTGLVAHTQNVSCGDDAPCSVISDTPAMLSAITLCG